MKVIRDIVHGYIELQNDDIDIIDTPIFQRLKRIRQLTSQSVYPSTNHTRFEHSLGVMDLGCHVFSSLESKKEIGSDFFEKYKNAVRYACMLHDIGHAPLSHVCEKFYDISECKDILKTFSVNIEDGARHEFMSCSIALKHFDKRLAELKVDKELFCRMITGNRYDSCEWELNILIDLLNSLYDVDKLDYVIRDGKMSGGDFITLDKNRVIGSYTINKKKLVFSSAVLSTISNLVYGRDALYMWVYNHHIAVYIDSLVQRYIQYLIDKNLIEKKEFFSFDAISEKMIDDSDIVQMFKKYMNNDEHTKRLYEQIFYRKYLKPLWKTPFEFAQALTDQSVRDKTIEDAKAGKLEIDINNDLDLKEDDLYVVLAAFKPFNPENNKNIYINIRGTNESFTNVFKGTIHQKQLKDLPYILTKPELKQRVIEYLNGR